MPVRIVVASAVFLTLVGVLCGGIWAQGGFAAGERLPAEPGESIDNDLFTLTAHEATLEHEESFGRVRQQVVVHGELALHDDEAVRSSTILNSLLDLELLPGGHAPDPSAELLLERRVEAGAVSLVQPRSTEDVRLVWYVPEEVETVDEIRLVVQDAEYGAGFIDDQKRWWNPDDTAAGQYVLPVAGE
ncbi:hypothetical protein [Lipingzhangella rawalii]|uniref:hypothetical protein n=1 Tax=Lipingzhangella rawalii TaxID=2055835 RepID=UPI00287B9421|nr:hypothetical protein [Lipingzhangella rawalii]